jgi:hypothetical protein
LFALGVFAQARAIDIVDEHKDVPTETQVGVAHLISLPGGGRFTLTEIPVQANAFRAFVDIPADFTKPKYKAAMARLTLGDEVTREEVIAVLDAHFHEVAFDYDSVKLRKLQVGARRYVSWCAAPGLFGACYDTQFRAGTWVEFEVNGKNRHGGMVGFERNIVLIRKLKAAEPVAPAATKSGGDEAPDGPK